MKFSNIILIGFMGSGKSSIGKRLAREIGHDYLDSDELVTKKRGLTVSGIFETHGEEAFRKEESEVLKGLVGKKQIVLSTGGGAILLKKNQEILRSLGTVLWLHASIDTLFERARRNTYRPLLEVEYPRHTFNKLLSSRLPLYQNTSHCQVDTTDLSYQQTTAAILKTVEDHQNRKDHAKSANALDFTNF